MSVFHGYDIFTGNEEPIGSSSSHVIWTQAEVVPHFWCTKAREGLMQIRLPLSGIVECLAEPSRFNLDDKITLVLCTK